MVGFAFLCSTLLFAISPPTEAVGDAGWIVAGAAAIAILCGALRLRLGGERVGPNELLAMSYALLAAIALFDWLAGGDNSPYRQLYIFPLLWAVFVHPLNRVLVFFAAYLGAIFWSLYLRGGFGGAEVGELLCRPWCRWDGSGRNDPDLGPAQSARGPSRRRERSAAAGRDRPADRPRKPPAPDGQPRGVLRRARRWVRRRAPAPRPRRVQGVQRHLRASGGRRAPARLAHTSTRLPARSAFRMGGDEFCVLSRWAGSRRMPSFSGRVEAPLRAGRRLLGHRLVRHGHAAGRSRGPQRSASRGRPRMYARKASRRTSPGCRARDGTGRVARASKPRPAPTFGERRGAVRGRRRRLGLDEEELDLCWSPHRCTTSGRPRSPTRFSTSRARSTTKSGRSSGAIRSSATASSERRQP